MIGAFVVPLEGLDPDPDTARDWLRDELSRPDYQPTLVERFQEWVSDFLDGVRNASEAISGFNAIVAFGALALLLGLGAFALSRLRANPTVTDEGRPVFDSVRRSAAQHRELAKKAALSLDWHAVVVESTRALAAGLFERGVLVEDVGATAHEISTSAARSFPAFRERLDRGARVFDETMYGDRLADADRAREVMALEIELRSVTPAKEPARGPVSAVPR